METQGVYVKSGGKPVWKKVQTGLSNEIFTEIKSELEPGQEVVVKGMEKLPDRKSWNPLFKRKTKGKTKK